MIDADTLAACATTPIPGEAPAGTGVRYEPEFTRLEGELEKLSSLHGDGEVDWRMIADRCVEILTGKSKDLLVAVYLAHALHRLDGAPGLRAGLQLLLDLVPTFWDDMQPPAKRQPARRAAFQWLADRSSSLLEERAVASQDELEVLRACGEQLAALQDAVLERLDGDDSGLGSLIRVVRQTTQAAEGTVAMDTAEDDAAAAGPTSGPGAAAPRPAPVGPVVDRADALKRLESLIAFFENTEPHSPIVPLLKRGRRWCDMDFQSVVGELLARDNDARKRLWETLGLPEE